MSDRKKKPRPFKSKSLVISDIKTGKKREIIIKNQLRNGNPTKMSHVFNYLPNGIIDKTITGLGGTSLELDSNRDSIIVEPIVHTAQMKSQVPSLTNGYQIHFYGRKRLDTPKKSGKAVITTKGLPKDEASTVDQEKLMRFLEFTVEQNITVRTTRLLEYITQCRQNNQPVKIVCVADQLTNLKEEKIKEDLWSFSNSYLLLDEVDNMQEHSSFRDTMHDCMEIYINHPEPLRIMMSATIFEFSDPRLIDEPFTKISYEDREHIEVAVFQTNSIDTTIAKLILAVKETHPNDKILVAYNHIDGIKGLLELLANHEIDNDTVAVLCSEQSKGQFKNNYATIQGTKLPAEINIITSAYFNGFDIYDKAHLIVAAHSHISSLRIDTTTIYQIYGRLRDKPVSFSIVLSSYRIEIPLYSKEDLLNAAEIVPKLNSLIDYTSESSNKYLQESSEVIANIFENGHKDFPSIWARKDNELSVSYIKIDSVLQNMRACFSLIDYRSFATSLQSRFVIKDLQEKIEQKEDRKKDDLSILKEFHSEVKKKLPVKHKQEIPLLADNYNSKHVKIIVDLYKRVYENPLFIADELPRQIDLALEVKQYKQNLRYIKQHMDFHHVIFKHKDKPVRKVLYEHFYKTGYLQLEDLIKKIEDTSSLFQALTKHDKPYEKKIVNEITTTKSYNKKFRRVLFKEVVKKTNKKNRYWVRSLNPYKMLNTEVADYIF